MPRLSIIAVRVAAPFAPPAEPWPGPPEPSGPAHRAAVYSGLLADDSLDLKCERLVISDVPTALKDKPAGPDEPAGPGRPIERQQV